jgi:GNAT superfamily N-acetyltransferase
MVLLFIPLGAKMKKINLISLTLDHELLVKKLATSLIGTKFRSYYNSMFESYDDINKSRLWGTFNQSHELIGCCGIIDAFYDKNKCLLSWFLVDKKYQRIGLGKYMMDFILDLALVDGYEWIYTESYNDKKFKKTNNFYEKYGFEYVGSIKGFLENKSDVIYYRKKIK